jgi:type IV fimbrial biogenesis protein FimT
MDRISGRKTGRGLTLVELLAALAILAVTAVLTAPGLQRLIQDSRSRTQTSRLLDALNLARNEAVSRNLPVSLCPSSVARTGLPVCGGDYTDGWMVFTNRERDGEFSAGEDEIVRAFAAIPAGYSLTNRAGTQAFAELITYLPDGSARRSLTLLLCPPGREQVEPMSVVLNTVGRARVGRGEGQCPGGPA